MIQLKNYKSEAYKTTFADAVGEVAGITIRQKEMEHPETQTKVYRASATVMVFVDKASLEEGGNAIDTVKKDFFLTAKERADLLNMVTSKIK